MPRERQHCGHFLRGKKAFEESFDSLDFVQKEREIKRNKRIGRLIFHLCQSSRYRMYDYSYSWLILGSKLNKSASLLDDSAYSMTTNLALAIANGSDYDLYDVFNHCKYRGGHLNVTKLGSWRRGTGLTITLTQPLVQRRANMNGITLKISGVVRILPRI